MKRLLLTGLAGTLLFFSCRKSVEDRNYPFVDLQSCASTSVNGSRVRICYDSLFDSRCPPNLMCIWGGYAAVKLRLSANGQQRDFKLSTVGHIPMLPSSDTVVLGYTVKLLEVSPNTASGTPYVKIEISQ